MIRSIFWRPIPGRREPCRWCPRCAIFPWPESPPRSCWAKNCPNLTSPTKRIPHFGVKEAVFPFNMFPEVDPVLGPEMRSTGEVLGMADSFGLAFFKAQEATKDVPAPGGHGAVHRGRCGQARRSGNRPVVSGFEFSDSGHQRHPPVSDGPRHRCPSRSENSVTAGRILWMRSKTTISNWSSIPRAGKESQEDDSYIRKAAINYKVPYITTIASALAAAKGIRARRQGVSKPKSLQEYHADIR